MDIHRPILDLYARQQQEIAQKSAIRWGIVATTSPLRVALDGDIDENGDPVLAPAQSAVTGLTSSMRVLCAEQHRRVIVMQAVV